MRKIVIIKSALAACALTTWIFGYAAEPLRICIGAQAYPPLLYPTRDGTVQVLINMAAKQMGMQVKYEPMPLPKCVRELHAGTMQASVVGFTDANAAYLDFPKKKGGEVDTSRAVATARSFSFRLKGSNATWDGSRFSGVKQPILFSTGNALFAAKARSLNIPFNDQTATFARNLEKMMAGQGEIVIGFEQDGKDRLAAPEVSAKIEVLPSPFTEAAYYMAISKPYYEKNKQQLEDLWSAIGMIKKTPAYLSAVENIK